MKTRDDWLVVKQLSPIELESLVSFAPAYFEYMSQAFFHEVSITINLASYSFGKNLWILSNFLQKSHYQENCQNGYYGNGKFVL
jgi:hypothetical protein